MMPRVRLRVCMRIAMNVISINATVWIIHGIRVVSILPIQILMGIVVRWQVMSVYLIRLCIPLRLHRRLLQLGVRCVQFRMTRRIQILTQTTCR